MIKSPNQYGLMQAAAHGKIHGAGPTKEVAEEFIHKTPSSKRKKFAKIEANKK